MLTFANVDFDEFHTRELPARIAAGNGRLAGPDVAGAPAFAFRVGDAAYTYVPTGDSVEIRAGDADAATVIALDAPTFSDYANELRHTCFGLVYGDEARLVAGSHDDWFRWEPAIRRAVRRPAALRPGLGRRARPAPARSRSPTPTTDIAAFLAAAGFAHVRGVFDADGDRRARRRDRAARGRRHPRRREVVVDDGGRRGPVLPAHLHERAVAARRGARRRPPARALPLTSPARSSCPSSTASTASAW